MFGKNQHECKACEAWKEVNSELRVQIGILNQRISDLQDELFKRDERLATQYSQLVDTFTGKNRPIPAPQNGTQIRVGGAPSRMSGRDWSIKKRELEEDSRRKVEMFRSKIKEAEEKGTLPRQDGPTPTE